jgi:hypothetical protein
MGSTMKIAARMAFFQLALRHIGVHGFALDNKEHDGRGAMVIEPGPVESKENTTII